MIKNLQSVKNDKDKPAENLNMSQERIVITGGAGFLGQHLQTELLRLGVSEKNMMIPHIEDYDLTKEADVIRMYDEMKPDVVIHLAAEVGGIGANMENPGRFFYANMAMGMHLIEHARLRKIKKFVQVGTICAYPNLTPVPFKEEDLWNGYPEVTNAPYGIAKKSLLVMLQAYRQQYDLNGIYLLPVNLYGPGDNFNPNSSHVIPALIRKFCTALEEGAEEVVVWGTGSASREFFYVEDAARAIALSTQKYESAEPVNLGAGFEITIKDLAEKIKDLTGFKGKLVWDTTKPDGQPRRCLDTTRAKECFGFEAKMSFDEGLKRTIDWWKEKSTQQAEEDALKTKPLEARRIEAIRSSQPASKAFSRDDTKGKKALITGITGQDGSYLAELLLGKGYEVHGLIRRSSTFNTQRINHLYKDPHNPEAKLFLHYADLTDGTGLREVLSRVQPDEVYNLGAQSHVRVSFDQPVYTVQVDALGTMRLLEAIRDLNIKTKYYQASSSEMFGKVVEIPQTEKTPFHPRSPYGCAKVYSFWQTVNYRESYDMFCCNGILFNHESPRRGETFVTRKITRAATRIKEGLQDKLFLGNLDAKRDWGYAGDFVEAMWLMMQQEKPDDYVIATGETHSIRDFLDLAFGQLELDWKKHVEIDPRYYRPAEVDILLGDSSKAQKELEWRLKVNFEQLATMMVQADWELAQQEKLVTDWKVANGNRILEVTG